MVSNSRDFDIKYLDAVKRPDGGYINKIGTIMWYNEEGQVHREEGPAFIGSDIAWYFNDRSYTFDNWCIAANKTDEEKMLLRLQYG
jgi:hypothetical protein